MDERHQSARANESAGTVFNLMRFAVSDGPGIRTTVFLKGCPLACLWCHNPESQKPAPEAMIAEERCIVCGECVEACHHQANTMVQGKAVRDAEKCEICGECCERCPTEARRIVGHRTTVQELMKVIVRDRIVYEESGGGVTFSGGEPLMQAGFLYEMLSACRGEGIHTTVDTCGFAPAETFARIAEAADLLLFDLKVMDDERHRQFTGVGNTIILENLSAAARSGKAVIVRVPVLPGVNDGAVNIAATIEFLRSVGVSRVDLLTYHETGVEKYRRIDRGNWTAYVPPTDLQMKRLREQFEAEGFSVRIGG
jgi:pyruvate formate lyase activating enzyme